MFFSIVWYDLLFSYSSNLFVLTPEDTLRLNALMTLSCAIRIDEYKMSVFGLTAPGEEKKVCLNPSGDERKYLEAVHDLLVSKVLGTMGGYPAYLKRWSRMGDVSLQNLASLLKLGNIEAVIAVANAKKLSYDILPLVWWCAFNTDKQAEIARYLLSRKEVVAHDIGKEIARYLLDFLPFIQNTVELMDSVNLLLQNSLISEEAKIKLWRQGQRKPVFLIGFLERLAYQLPKTDIAHLKSQEQGILYLEKINSPEGQIFLNVCGVVLKKINQEYVLYRLLEALGKYCAHTLIRKMDTLSKIEAQIDTAMSELSPNVYLEKVRARLFLAGISEHLVIQSIARYGLMGSTIRKKLAHILLPVQNALDTLLQ